MAIRIHMIDPRPRRTDLGPILDGVTKRPASWPSRAAAEATVAHYTTHNMWNHSWDDWAYEFRIVDTKEEPCETTEPPKES